MPFASATEVSYETTAGGRGRLGVRNEHFAF
jgi:hypothetical protein